tara:strand:- start:97 stop:828 length:732 start_codon:yes stop_codon:yes gene_type:complete
MKNKLIEIIDNSDSRYDLWSNFLSSSKLEVICELGVYKGDFAHMILKKCSFIQKYIMIDPWKNLSNWNKPANHKRDTFDVLYKETLEKTNFAEHKRVILKGTTVEVINKIPDASLDFIYIDGDHTLKGISVDLISTWKKIKKNGFLAGDDFCPSIWQHNINYEPTLVFPFALYFAEAMNTTIYALPYNQFLITKAEKGFEFINLTDIDYDHDNILDHIRSKISIRSIVMKRFPNMYKVITKYL